MKRYQLDLYKEEIINMYLNEKKSCNEISKIINCSLCGVYDALRRWNINTRNLSESHKQKNFNEQYFKVIDTEAKAYWLGFIYADGYITGKDFGISLSITDISHLLKFLKDIEADFLPKSYIGTGYSEVEYCRVLFKSSLIVNDLIDKGVFYNKSLILKFPTKEQVPDNLIRHFIRGYFDGDGSLVLSKNSINFKICGTKEFLSGIIDTLNKNCSYKYKNVLYKRHKDEKNNYYLSYGGRLKVIDALSYLYKDSNVYLDRKKEKYKKLINIK